jgi:hypothetical protein
VEDSILSEGNKERVDVTFVERPVSITDQRLMWMSHGERVPSRPGSRTTPPDTCRTVRFRCALVIDPDRTISDTSKEATRGTLVALTRGVADFERQWGSIRYLTSTTAFPSGISPDFLCSVEGSPRRLVEPRGPIGMSDFARDCGSALSSLKMHTVG